MPSHVRRQSSSSAEEDDLSQAQMRHYPSTPHLETFRVVSRSASTANPNSHYGPGRYGQAGVYAPSSQYMEKPVLSTFSTFAHHKSGTDLRYRDDPNPYKVSHIEEFRIQVQDPYRTRSTVQLNKPGSRSSRGSGSYYNGDEDVFDDDGIWKSSVTKFDNGKLHRRSNSSNNSGGYEVPDPDYGGSTGGSSEDLPLPLPPDLPPPSDTSEEYQHSLSISASSASGGPSPSPIHEEPESPHSVSPMKISDADRRKIEFALRGRKTEVYAADSLANLYVKVKSPTRPSSVGSGMTSSSGQSTSPVYGGWSTLPKYCGVPALLLDKGETKSRDKRRIQIVLVELGSGLVLWRDVVDNLTSYQVDTPLAGRDISTFHTMHESKDHTRVIGLSFDYEDTADWFAKQVDRLTSDFANISLSGSKYKNAKNKEKTKKVPKWIRPKKSEISQPCGFLHVSSVSSKDTNLLSSLQTFVRSPGTKNNNNATTEISH